MSAFADLLASPDYGRTHRVGTMQCGRTMTPHRAVRLANDVTRDRGPMRDASAIAVSRLAHAACGTMDRGYCNALLDSTPACAGLVWA